MENKYNPGYNPLTGRENAITKLVRYSNRDEQVPFPEKEIDPQELREIQEKARGTWLQRKPFMTTYKDTFSYNDDYEEPQTNTTMPMIHDKRNKPHPPM